MTTEPHAVSPPPTSLRDRVQPRDGLLRWIWSGIDRRVLVLLLVVDGGFLVAHGAHVYTTEILDRSRWYFLALDNDQGLAEIWQYGKFGFLVIVLAVLARRGRSAVLGAWAFSFAVLGADDMLELHERAGRVLSDGDGAGQALGELLYLVAVGAVLLFIILVAWSRSPTATDRFAQALLGLGMFLVVVGLGGDVVHSLVDDQDVANQVGRYLEDGGELVVLSAVVAAVWGLRSTVPSRPDPGQSGSASNAISSSP